MLKSVIETYQNGTRWTTDDVGERNTDLN